jgi:hypothetical protein
MMAKLKARKAELARLREERGATDPILIIAGIAITLILLVGGSFAISGFIANANNLNAKGDLDRIATAQAAYMVQKDGYGALAYGPNVSSPNTQLQDAALGFEPSQGTSAIVRTSPAGWVAVTKSASGTVYLRTSQSGDTVEVPGAMAPAPASYSAWSESRKNLAANPNANGGFGFSRAGGNTASVTVSSDSAIRRGTTGTSYKQTVTVAGQTGSMALAPDLAPGEARWSMWVYSSRAGNVNMYAEGNVNGAYAGFSGGPASIPTANTWTLLTGTGIAPSTGTLSGWRLGFYSLNLQPGDVLYVDDITIEQNVSAVGTNFSGSTPSSDPLVAYEWTGATDASASIMKTRAVNNSGALAWTPGTKPANVNLPTGISWSDVSADLMDVYS